MVAGICQHQNREATTVQNANGDEPSHHRHNHQNHTHTLNHGIALLGMKQSRQQHAPISKHKKKFSRARKICQHTVSCLSKSTMGIVATKWAVTKLVDPPQSSTSVLAFR